MDWLIKKIADFHNDFLRKIGMLTDKNYNEKDIFFRDRLYDYIATTMFFSTGILIGCFFETLFFFIVFNILRRESNGWHSYDGKYHYEYCLLITSFIVVPSVLFSKYYFFNNIWLYIISIFCIIYTFVKTPVLNLEWEMEIKTRSEYKFDYLYWSISFYILSIVTQLKGLRSVSNAILISIIWIAPFMNKKFGNFLKKLYIIVFRN